MKRRVRIFLSVVLGVVFSLTVLSACSSNEGTSGTTSSSDSAETSSDTPIIDGMSVKPISSSVMSRVVGTWHAKGVWFDADEPIITLSDDKDLQGQYGDYALEINEDNTSQFQTKNSLESGVWEYYGEADGLQAFAMSCASNADSSSIKKGDAYLFFISETSSGDVLVIQKQDKDTSPTKIVMLKESSSGTSSSSYSSSSSASSSSSSAATVQSASSGERNALASAKSYLNTSAFSYSGLIEQLEYEGYTSSEARYAVDNCGADWFEQAVKSAESYLRTSSFSRSALVEQLEYEGFTHEQAEYGVDKAY